MVMRFPTWTPETIDRMDPDFIDELTARLEAEQIQDEKRRKRVVKK